VIENKALARSLYDGSQIDQFIPAEFYRTVAEIIHYLHEAKLKVSL
jgi:flagellar biosynthetic protein FlhB